MRMEQSENYRARMEMWDSTYVFRDGNTLPPDPATAAVCAEN